MITPPPVKSKIDSDAWIEFFSEAFLALSALQSYGITAKRPTKYLYPGRTYFDTTLNRPIWVSNNGTTWVFSDGSPA